MEGINTTTTILSFLSTYLLAFTVCFIGSFIRELTTANTTHTKIQIKRIVIEAIISTFFAAAINRILANKFNIPLEVQLAISFVCGFWSDSILDLLTNKTFIVALLRAIFDNFGAIGKTFSECIKNADEENRARKENYKSIKNNNKCINNKNKEDEKE